MFSFRFLWPPFWKTGPPTVQWILLLPATSFQAMLPKISNGFTNIYHRKNVSISSHFALGDDSMALCPWGTKQRSCSTSCCLEVGKHAENNTSLLLKAQRPILTLIFKVKLILSIDIFLYVSFGSNFASFWYFLLLTITYVKLCTVSHHHCKDADTKGGSYLLWQELWMKFSLFLEKSQPPFFPASR